MVIEFIKALPKDNAAYYFALGVNAGQVSATLVQLKKLMKKQGLDLGSGFDICMPNNYIPWGGPGDEVKIKDRYEKSLEKIKVIAPIIKSKEVRPVNKGSLWQRIIFSWLYRLSFKHVHGMDAKFWVDDKCNSCGICAKVCPANNIEITVHTPQWLHKCEQCLACIQWCPQEAIQYGKKTVNYDRYRNWDITIKDILNSVEKEV